MPEVDMQIKQVIHTQQELEFAIFCIESVAIHLGIDAKRVYAALCEKSDLLNRYIVPNYDVLHTQSKDYIVEDILTVMREEGINL